ncbi:MAG: HNH endonuclease, partial [Leptolyngbyaceae cyanobacterium HOT.MB2.61]|nr:HNH endonuclease [Leptolyngbyaceae cyanobacterium HOT.MB2.61]
MLSEKMRQLREKADRLEGIKLKAHKVVNQVYKDVVEEYETWRFSEEGLGFVRQQLEKLDYVCPVCGEALSEKKATLDHLLPKRRYLHKAIDTENLLVMCYDCNKTKKSTEFPEWRESLPKLHRQSLDYALRLLYSDGKLKKLLSESKRLFEKSEVVTIYAKRFTISRIIAR